MMKSVPHRVFDHYVSFQRDTDHEANISYHAHGINVVDKYNYNIEWTKIHDGSDTNLYDITDEEVYDKNGNSAARSGQKAQSIDCQRRDKKLNGENNPDYHSFNFGHTKQFFQKFPLKIFNFPWKLA